MAATKTRPQEREETGRFAAGVAQAVEKAAEVGYEEIQIKRQTGGERALNNALAAVQDFLSVDQSQAVAITLYAAATHAVGDFKAFGRLLFTSEIPSSGKSTAVRVAALLSANPENVNGSKPALTSMMAEFHNSPERGRPTLYKDEVSDIFGTSGLNSATNNPLANILREGYEYDATDSWSVSRTRKTFSIYAPFILAGNGASVPQDIRSRSVVVRLIKGRPNVSLDSDGAKGRLLDAADVLASEIAGHHGDLKGFRCDDGTLSPKLVDRDHQVWRPLIGIAMALGGARWTRMAVQAFEELTGNGAKEALSTDQKLTKDLHDVVLAGGFARDEFVVGSLFRNALRHLPRFEGWADRAVSMEIARVMPVEPVKRRVPGKDNPVHGYYAGWIMDAWAAIKPEPQSETDGLMVNPVDLFED